MKCEPFCLPFCPQWGGIAILRALEYIKAIYLFGSWFFFYSCTSKVSRLRHNASWHAQPLWPHDQLWRCTTDCTKPDDRSTWTWLVLQGDVWQQHGKAVADALHHLPSWFDCPSWNITEKLTSGYKAWEFLLYLYSLGPGLPLWHTARHLLCKLPQAYLGNVTYEAA